ncbi:4Fe-4S double cluster binding domain-containing protein [Methanolacinia paynteri]|uniref:4Fe-4S double cluster binding domain-containing protein n=1 Tax=Methanolacinia paynteri TaxID=230356 RepID=UPI000694FFA6|nr:4Fe-4S double cluster binding domain-containing protein [Methanolacinia paynteri]
MSDLKKETTRITEELDNFIGSCDAAIWGYCDLSGITNRPFPELRNGISMGIKLNPKIVLSLKEGPGEEYTREYDEVNIRLAELAGKVSEFLKDLGYNAGFIPPTQSLNDPEKLYAKFPHKTAATLSGLGWIGKNALLVTKKYGSALRIITIFTDSPVTTGDPVVKSYCGDCNNCRELCPAGAVRGVKWSQGMSREEILNTRGCFEYSRKMGYEAGPGHGVCGRCIVVCPWTEKYLKREGVL